MDSSSGCAAILPHAESAQRRRAALLRCPLHFRVKTAAVAVHRHQQRAEVPNAKLPQRFWIEVIEVHVLDSLDPGRLQRRGAADDGEVGAAQIAERSEGFFAQAALADQEPHAALRSEEHTSELQSQSNLVCRLLLEKKKHTYAHTHHRVDR